MENTAYSYTYDANGNLLSRTDKADNSVSKYSYNADNKLVRVEMPEGVVVAYTYDAGGRRIKRTVSKAGTETVTRYVYDGENIIAELDKDGNPTEIFTNGPGIDEPLIMKKADGSEYYYHADALGSITALSDGKGQIAERMAYTAYGLPTRYNAKGEFIENSAIGNTRTYTAREQDDDTGLYYYRARYYDAETGRFTQEDPIGFKGGDTNLYAYAKSQPIQLIDPSGEIFVVTPAMIAAGAGVGAVGGFAGSVLGQAFTQDHINWTTVGQSTLSGAITGAMMPVIGTTRLGAAVLGGVANAAQYYLTTDANKFNTGDLAVTTAFGLAGGFFGGEFIKASPYLTPKRTENIFVNPKTFDLMMWNYGTGVGKFIATSTMAALNSPSEWNGFPVGCIEGIDNLWR